MICGYAIITYEHIDPTFKDAREHDPECITLLCGSHHLESSKGLLPKERIKEHDQDPFCKRTGYAKCAFDLRGRRPKLLLGSNDFTECGPKIEFDGEILFEVLPPERESSRWRLSALFRDLNGRVICQIKENELIVNAHNFDFIETATRFAISLPKSGTFLELELNPYADAVILKKYSVITKHGKMTIKEELMPNLHGFLNASPSKKLTLTLETSSSRISFADSSFISPKGIIIRSKDGGFQFGGV